METTTTRIFKTVGDVHEGTGEEILCIRVEGAGDIPGSPFHVEHFPDGAWTAWYLSAELPQVCLEVD